MRERVRPLTQEFVAKLNAICLLRPQAAYYDQKLNRLNVMDGELFALSVKQVDDRTLPTFLKRMKAIGFKEVEGFPNPAYEWVSKGGFTLIKQVNKVNQMVSMNIRKRKTSLQSILKRKEYVDSMLQKLIFQILVTGKQGDGQISRAVEAAIGEVQGILKATTQDSIEAIDQIQRLEEQELHIYRNLVSNEGPSRY